MAVYDRWHKARAAGGEEPCAEHGKHPTPRHGVGKRWQVRWRDANDHQLKRSFDRRVDAERYDTQVRHADPAARYIAAVRDAVRLAQQEGIPAERIASLTDAVVRGDAA